VEDLKNHNNLQPTGFGHRLNVVSLQFTARITERSRDLAERAYYHARQATNVLLATSKTIPALEKQRDAPQTRQWKHKTWGDPLRSPRQVVVKPEKHPGFPPRDTPTGMNSSYLSSPYFLLQVDLSVDTCSATSVEISRVSSCRPEPTTTGTQEEL